MRTHEMGHMARFTRTTFFIYFKFLTTIVIKYTKNGHLGTQCGLNIPLPLGILSDWIVILDIF